MNRKKKPKKPEAKKIWARMCPKEYERLKEIKRKYGFKSEYQIVQYVMAAFMRVADPENDPNEEPVPEEITSMFYDLSHADREFDFVKPKRKLPQKEIDDITGQLRIWQ